jgi:flagellar FliJ protein
MPFRFSLQAVLRCRESFERRERQRLEVVTHEVVKAQKQCQQAKLDRADALGQVQKKLHQGMPAVEMQFELACDQARVRRIAALNDHASKLEDLRRRQLEIFRKAQQQRKILENLRDRQLAAYQLVQARRAQQQMDDRFLITHAGQSSSMSLQGEEP